jgi:hypothetical protein
MAKLTGGFTFKGSLGEISAYRMRGTDFTILRHKGGPPKERIKRHPNFEQTRRNNEEWKGCVLAVKSLIRAVYGVKHLADYNYAASLQALCKSIQSADTIQEKGKRSISFSQQQHRLEGFGFNREHFFETLLRNPLQFSVDKTAGTATVEIPQLIPGINFHNPKKEPHYRLIFMLGIVPDIVYDESNKLYLPVSNDLPHPAIAKTPWHCWKEGSGPQTLQVNLQNLIPAEGLTLVLAAGAEFGRPYTITEIRPVKYAGTARILKVV